MEKLLRFINSLSPEAREVFAATCGTSVGYLRKAVSCKQVLGPGLCFRIERASAGNVTRFDLRPKSWGDTWPELIDEQHPWPVQAQEVAA